MISTHQLTVSTYWITQKLFMNVSAFFHYRWRLLVSPLLFNLRFGGFSQFWGSVGGTSQSYLCGGLRLKYHSAVAENYNFITRFSDFCVWWRFVHVAVFRGTQLLFSAKCLFGEANIASKRILVCLIMRTAKNFWMNVPFMYNFRGLYLINSLPFSEA